MTAIPAWPQGYALREFDVIDSTNEEARRLALAGEAGPIWIWAGRQTAGRGRRGRSWQSPGGNLSATLLLTPKENPARAAQLSFVAALAVADTVQIFAPEACVALKWPNDVLAGGRKIAGILLESESGSGSVVDWLAIGIGVNLAEHPPGSEFPATSLAALGTKVPPARDALRLLADRWTKWYECWRGQGFADIRDAWITRAANVGARIRARLQNEETSGVFEGIDDNGALVLRETADRVRIIAAGDIFF